MKSLRIYSFFSGAGFLDLGFETEGFFIDFVNEYNEAFLEVYKYARKNMNLKGPQYGYYCGDINDLLKGKRKKELLSYINADRNICSSDFRAKNIRLQRQLSCTLETQYQACREVFLHSFCSAY